MNQHEEAIKRVEALIPKVESRPYLTICSGEQHASDLRLLLELVKRGEADRERVDWLEADDVDVGDRDHPFYKRIRLVSAHLDDWHDSVRAAIDAARHSGTPDGESL